MPNLEGKNTKRQNQNKEKKSEDPKKAGAAKGMMGWLKENWKKSAILMGTGAVMGTAMGQDGNVARQGDREFVNPEKPNKTYVVEGGHILEKKVKRGGKKIVYIYKGEIGEGRVIENKNSNLDPKSEVKQQNQVSQEKTIGTVTGSGENFRAEVPYNGGIRLFKGAEGEAQYKQWVENFKKSGGRMGESVKVESQSNSSSQLTQTERKGMPGNQQVKVSGSGESFYAEIPTREGTRVFKGAQGEQQFKQWQENMNRNRR